MFNVICLKQGVKFDAEYVNKLFYGVRRNTTLDFTFHCFTEDPRGLDPAINIHALPDVDIDGWWFKLYLFSNEITIKGTVLYLDLDTLITGNIDHYITYSDGFTVLRDLWSKQDNVGSAIMSFEAGKYNHIWETFIADPVSMIASVSPHGDQKVIQALQKERKYWQDLFPGEIISFKSNNALEPQPVVNMVCFHGIPSIKDSIVNTTHVQGFVLTPAKWVSKFWCLT